MPSRSEIFGVRLKYLNIYACFVLNTFLILNEYNWIMILLDEPGILKIYYEEETQTQVHEWLNYNPNDNDSLVIRLLDQIYNLLLKYPVKKILVITNNTEGVFTPEVQKYIQNVQFPRLSSDTPIRFVATVKTADEVAASGTTLWKEQLKMQKPIIIYDSETEADAREWLKQMDDYD